MESQQQIIPADPTSPHPPGLEVRDLPYVSGSPSTGLVSSHSLELVHVFDKMKAVRGFIFDIDGVFTNNEILVTEAGELLRTMNVRDGQAIRWAIEAGYPIGIITGGRSEGVKKRFTYLGISEYYSGISDKAAAFQSFQERTNLLPSEICYMGDDLPDLPVLRKVVLSCCPFDAVPEVLEVCDYISPLRGGMGCVRDIVEKIMKLQEKWPEL
jgi:3-deoxy-D-manno-octulosonate 8-phosphate phosphatase (KDO 8-P phosphatase)